MQFFDQTISDLNHGRFRCGFLFFANTTHVNASFAKTFLKIMKKAIVTALCAVRKQLLMLAAWVKSSVKEISMLK